MSARASLATNGTAPGRRVHFRCPGCDDVHGVTVDEGPVVWRWNGDLDLPTFTPSILLRGNQWPKDEYPEYYKPTHSRVAPGDDTVCHSFVTDGPDPVPRRLHPRARRPDRRPPAVG